jgi:hypothetical protein
MLNGQHVSNEFKKKTEEFVRLLNHYLIYIGGLLNLVDTSSQATLTTQCSLQWDKPGWSAQAWTEDEAEGFEDFLDVPKEYVGSSETVQQLSSEPTDLEQLLKCAHCSKPLFGGLHDDAGICNCFYLPLNFASFEEAFSDANFYGPDPSSFSEYESIDASAFATTEPMQTHLSNDPTLSDDASYAEKSYYQWGRVPGKFSALKATNMHDMPMIRSDDIANTHDTSSLEQENQSYSSRSHDSANYWTFYNQNEPFKIHSEADRLTFTNAVETEVQGSSDALETPTSLPQRGNCPTCSHRLTRRGRCRLCQPVPNINASYKKIKNPDSYQTRPKSDKEIPSTHPWGFFPRRSALP